MINASQARIGIIGLGYVGLPLAVEFGKTMSVVGFDINQERINELSSGFDVTKEVDEGSLKAAKHLQFSAVHDDLNACQVFIVTVPTPIDSANRPNLTPLCHATETVAKSISRGAIIIYESTVFPGCTEEICVPLIERISGLKYNQDFFVGYSPERINPGDKTNTLVKVKKITSGSTPEIAQYVDNLYQKIIVAGTFKATSIKVAEAAKVIENTQRDLNIALVNELSIIFARMNIDTSEVLEAAGSKWNFIPFKPGMVGGHCIGVDPYYLTHKAEELGYHPQVILAGRRINDNMGRYAARNVIKLMINNGIDVARCTVGVMGVTFKENCPDIRNSKVIDLINEFKDWNIDVVVCDPWANKDEVFAQYDIQLLDFNEMKKVDSLVVAVGHNEFRRMTPADLRPLCQSAKPILADIKALYDKNSALDAGFTVFRF